MEATPRYTARSFSARSSDSKQPETTVTFVALREWLIQIVSRRGARNQVIGHHNVNRVFGPATRHVAGYAVRFAGLGMVGARQRRVAC